MKKLVGEVLGKKLFVAMSYKLIERGVAMKS